MQPTDRGLKNDVVCNLADDGVDAASTTATATATTAATATTDERAVLKNDERRTLHHAIVDGKEGIGGEVGAAAEAAEAAGAVVAVENTRWTAAHAARIGSRSAAEGTGIVVARKHIQITSGADGMSRSSSHTAKGVHFGTLRTKALETHWAFFCSITFDVLTACRACIACIARFSRFYRSIRVHCSSDSCDNDLGRQIGVSRACQTTAV